MLGHCRAAIVSLARFTLITGAAYPAIVTVIVQADRGTFPRASGKINLRS